MALNSTMRLLQGKSTLRRFIAGIAACIMIAACEPPPEPVAIGAAIPELPPPAESSAETPLPDAVAATVERLREIGAKGSYRDMAALADQTPSFRSNNAGMRHGAYWYLKLRTGDWPMAQMERVLALPYAVRPSPRGKVYIWPKFATLGADEITPATAREIDKLLGEGQADAIRNGEIWPGYVLGIAEDGTWLYFVSGAG